MRHLPLTRVIARPLQGLGLAALALLLPPVAMAQPADAPPADSRTVTEVRAGEATAAGNEPVPVTGQASEPAPAVETSAWTQPALAVGEATQSLLALQRAGTSASATPRPIPGEIAHRSYERYLKSFEYPIPESFNSTVKTSGSGGSSR